MEVLGIDNVPENVQHYASLVTHVVEGDATNVDVLRQLGVAEIRHAVVGIGSDIESSILATAALDELGVPGIWAKAVSSTHGRILQRVGAHHVIHAEHDMGHRVAHLVGGRVQEWFQIDEDFAIVETAAPTRLVGRSLAELDLRAAHDVTIVFVKQLGGSFTFATPDTVLQTGDVLLVAGGTVEVEAFARLG
ncbi:MAG: TrkA family potassium uptake protein [Actinomycetota bacterium]|nr:TrkA family potassium uptake protein [Actinomycetota bacterium]